MVFFGHGCGVGEAAVGQSHWRRTPSDAKSAHPHCRDLSQAVGAAIPLVAQPGYEGLAFGLALGRQRACVHACNAGPALTASS